MKGYLKDYFRSWPTVKELRKEAESYGLSGYPTLDKYDLIELIAEARAMANFQDQLRKRSDRSTLVE